MVRVLMYGPDATSGGVATHTKRLTEELSKLGIVVILYCCSLHVMPNELIRG